MVSGARAFFAVRIPAGGAKRRALPFINGELEFDRCPVAVSRLGPPTSKSFDQPAKDRRRFPQFKKRGEIGA